MLSCPAPDNAALQPRETRPYAEARSVTQQETLIAGNQAEKTTRVSRRLQAHCYADSFPHVESLIFYVSVQFLQRFAQILHHLSCFHTQVFYD